MPTVLFVDDEPSILEGFKRTLRKEPFTIVVASSGAAALAALQTTAVDAIVSDQRMPGISGSELLERVRQRYPDIIRIMLTGEASLPATVRALSQAPLYRFLCKPVNSDDLVRTLMQALHMKEVTDQAAKLRRVGGARSAKT
jgi:DNA-binding NtrC family response regulator